MIQARERKVTLSQRTQYSKGGISRKYWDYRDECILSYIKNERRILDIGCGEGITLQKLLYIFPEKDISGIDVSRKNVEICKKYGLPVKEGNVYNLEFGDESVDCCIFIEVIEHLEYPLKALKEIDRVLRKGGLLVILFPNDFIFKLARIFTLKFKEAFYDYEHLKQWTPEEIRKVLTEKYFDILQQRSIPFRLWHCSLHHLVAARKRT